ncbi:MAG: hypothetical protein JF615_06600 [Asticcacaulis sp.]|nr:hypothetical protein [Asticcacaulis sp.]
MSSSNLHDDIAYMKSMAEAGNAGPLPNGATLFWAGILYGLASIGQYGLIQGWLPRTGWMAAVIWFGASIIFGVLAFALGFERWRRRGQPMGTRAVNFAWSAVGLGIVFLLLTMFVVSTRVSDFTSISYLIAPLILLLYGVGWWVSAQIACQGWLKVIAFGCFIGAPAMGYLTGQPEQLLAYAAALVLFAAVPGFVLMRAEKA